MDNQPRLPAGYDVAFEHGHMAWIDTTLQQIFANRLLMRMADEIGRGDDVKEIAAETERLAAFVNQHMWDARTAFYYDRFRDGSLSRTKSIGAYWALLAEVVPEDRLGQFIGHLRNPGEFARGHRVPALSADDPAYEGSTGGYWLGGVWAPTNYMVLRGLAAAGEHALAHEIGANHVEQVVKVFEATGTLWENYAPESASPGEPAKKDFVGWTGLSPIAILFENVFGLRAASGRNELVWDVRLLDEHGIDRYPFGPDATLDLRCAKRDSQAEEPVIEATATRPVKLVVAWAGGNKTMQLK
jgi:glycogen debranching enzyme